MNRQLPLEDFFRISERTGYQLSPDGTYISYMAPYKERLNIFVRRVNDTDEQATRITHETQRSVAGYMWADNERLLFIKDTAGDANDQLYGVRRDGSDERAYTAFEGVRTSIIDELEEQKGYILIGMNRRIREIFDPYRLNIETGELTLLAENPGNIQSWMTDHDGRLRVATAIVDGVNTQILYRDTEDEEFRPVLVFEPGSSGPCPATGVS